jgi:curved DNA-binding protein CbpA
MARDQIPATGNLYSRLGLDRGATDEQVRTAYYRLAKALHPDGRAGSERDKETFNSIVRAAAILRDPAKRELYDRGAIDEYGALAGSKGAQRRWSYRERLFAGVVAVLTLLVCSIAFYSPDRSQRPLSAQSAHAEHREKSPGAGPVSDEALPAPAISQGDQRALARPIDDSPAEPVKASQGRQAAYSPPPPAMASNQAEPAIAPAAAVRRDQAASKSSIISRKPPAAKLGSRIPPNSGIVVLSSYPKEVPQAREECSLTKAARDILAGIISH